MFRDFLDTWFGAARNLAGRGKCVLVCGVDAAVGTNLNSLRNNAVETAVAAGIDRGAKRVLSDLSKACMSNSIDKLAATAASRVTPGVNTLAGAYTVSQFVICSIKYGD